jgi:uncharacterized protein
MKGVELATSLDMVSLIDRQWEPLWQAAAEVDLPVHFHSSGFVPSSQKIPPPAHWSRPEVRGADAARLTTFPLMPANVLSLMIFSGALERHPKLRIVLGESGIGWIPFILDRMDYEWEDQFRHELDLKLKPSEYWRRQCKATFQYDEVGLRLIDMMGVETLMWGSDFPHGDGVWPDSQEYIAKQFGHLTKDVRDKIICGNAVEFYRL